MKVLMATIVSHEWDLLTFNINLHPELETELVLSGSVLSRLSERVRKHISREVGTGREYFFVIEGHSAKTGAQTYLHIHGAIATHDSAENGRIEEALLRAAGHNVRGRGKTPRATKAKLFEQVRVAYPNYLFKFTLRHDPRLDERRLVMSRVMTQAAAMFWTDIAHERTWV
ncbi:hypothetical protein VCJ71_03520 [Alteriqipengyuania sp. WL0013]|uniref:hypothetical protein n=1 Tax=Alteriqipengyuania sp. WL0013 TaxID=3110773 RepID=UPI002C8E64C2|nr:hypothetical protein [Alteriqipengyuania sp. WL0013]MEB3415129.1 hypothetical protein [Alteriqipengyuania sp. WL0013]